MVRVSKKCPKGTFCIENMTLVFIMLLITFLIGVVYQRFSNQSREAREPRDTIRNPVVMNERETNNYMKQTHMIPPELAVHQPIHIRQPQDVLSDPRRPPLQDTQAIYGLYNTQRMPPQVGVMPINQATQHPYRTASASDMNYHQLGILTRKSGEKILPLMGRRSQTQRNNWQYYTMSDGNQSIRLPISKNGRSCTRDNGCDEIMNGDTVYVEGYQDAFRATVYENDSPKYIPYLV